jgi:transposase
MAKPIVSDELWEMVEPVIPKVKRRRRYPGRKRVPDRNVLTGISPGRACPRRWAAARVSPARAGFGNARSRAYGPACTRYWPVRWRSDCRWHPTEGTMRMIVIGADPHQSSTRSWPSTRPPGSSCTVPR